MLRKIKPSWLDKRPKVWAEKKIETQSTLHVKIHVDFSADPSRTQSDMLAGKKVRRRRWKLKKRRLHNLDGLKPFNVGHTQSPWYRTQAHRRTKPMNLFHCQKAFNTIAVLSTNRHCHQVSTKWIGLLNSLFIIIIIS